MSKLRICVIGRADGHTFAGYIGRELNGMGHSARVLTTRSRLEAFARLGPVVRSARAAGKWLLPAGLRPQPGDLLRQLREHEPDLIVTTIGTTTPEMVSSWRRAAPQAVVVLWFPDCLANFGNQAAFMAGFDRIYVKDPYLVERLAVMGGIQELRYLPEGAPSVPDAWNRPPGPEEQEYSRYVAVVGNLHPSRLRLLEAIARDVPLRLYGSLESRHAPRWVRDAFSGRYISGEEKYRVFRYSGAVLNNLHYAEVDGVNFRMFDAASAGALILTEDRAAVRRYYEPGSEVLTYRTPAELVELYQQITPDTRQQIGHAAQVRTLKDHLLSARLQVMLDDLRI